MTKPETLCFCGHGTHDHYKPNERDMRRCADCSCDDFQLPVAIPPLRAEIELREEISKTMGWWGNGVLEGDCYPERTDKVMALISKRVKEAQYEKITVNRSYCGCSMCLHHTAPYESDHPLEKGNN